MEKSANLKDAERELQKTFKKEKMNDKDTKLLYAIGYLKASKLDKDDTITVIKHIFFEEIQEGTNDSILPGVIK